LEIKVRGDVMKPIPQEKCIIISTKGRRTRSAQLFPIISEAKNIRLKYAIGGMKNMGEKRNPETIDNN